MEDGGPAEKPELAELVWRQILHLAKTRRLHGCGAEILPPDVWRWYLTANAPESADSAFTWEQFQNLVNKDLADVLGNFVNRIIKFAESRFDGVVPAGGEPGELEIKLYAELSTRLADLAAQMEAIEIRKSAQALRSIWVLGNEYLTEAAPWTALKTDRDRAAVIVRTGLNFVALFARLIGPFIPFNGRDRRRGGG